MPVQALYDGSVRTAYGIRYCWAGDGTVLLALDCCGPTTERPMSYELLVKELKALCPWQLDANVVVCFPEELVEVLTIYHDIGNAVRGEDTLLLVSTPPDEYFEGIAA